MKLRTASIIISLTLLSAGWVFAANPPAEKPYRDAWCEKQGGAIELYAKNNFTRVNCLLNEVAYDVFFAPDWSKAIDQAIYFSNTTNRKTGIVLIMKNPDDKIYLNLLKNSADPVKIPILTITPQDRIPLKPTIK